MPLRLWLPTAPCVAGHISRTEASCVLHVSPDFINHLTGGLRKACDWSTSISWISLVYVDNFVSLLFNQRKSQPNEKYSCENKKSVLKAKVQVSTFLSLTKITVASFQPSFFLFSKLYFWFGLFFLCTWIINTQNISIQPQHPYHMWDQMSTLVWIWPTVRPHSYNISVFPIKKKKNFLTCNCFSKCSFLLLPQLQSANAASRMASAWME